jgi:hypothetical protein
MDQFFNERELIPGGNGNRFVLQTVASGNVDHFYFFAHERTSFKSRQRVERFCVVRRLMTLLDPMVQLYGLPLQKKNARAKSFHVSGRQNS